MVLRVLDQALYHCRALASGVSTCQLVCLINENHAPRGVCCQQRVHKALQRLYAVLLQLAARRFHKARGGHDGQGLHCSLRSGSGSLLLCLCRSGSGSGSVQRSLGGSLLL